LKQLDIELETGPYKITARSITTSSASRYYRSGHSLFRQRLTSLFGILALRGFVWVMSLTKMIRPIESEHQTKSCHDKTTAFSKMSDASPPYQTSHRWSTHISWLVVV
jgi:hypothetical protein